MPPYIKEQGGFGRPRGEARQEESYSYRKLDSPLFHVGLGERGGRGGWEEGKGGRRHPLLVLFGLGGRGVRPCPGLLSSLPPRPTKAH